MAKKKATKRPKKAKTAREPGTISCVAKLKQVSVGDMAASIGFQIDRVLLGGGIASLRAADDVLINARLDVTIEFDEEQAKLFPDLEPSLSAVADSAKVSMGKESLTGRLSFARDDVDLDQLSAFAAKSATLTLTRTGDREDADEDGEDEIDDRDPAGGDDKAVA